MCNFKITPLLFFLFIGGIMSVKPDPLLQRSNVYDGKGKRVGFVKENFLLNRHDIFDKDGKRTGYIKRNELLDRWEIRLIKKKGG